MATKLQVCFLLDNSSKQRREQILSMPKTVALALIIGRNLLTSLTAAKTLQSRSFHLWEMIQSTLFILLKNTGLVIIQRRSSLKQAPFLKRHPKTCKGNFSTADQYIIRKRYINQRSLNNESLWDRSLRWKLESFFEFLLFLN